MVRQNDVSPYLTHKWYGNCRAVLTDGAAQAGYQISLKSEHPLWKYDIISISQDGGLRG